MVLGLIIFQVIKSTVIGTKGVCNSMWVKDFLICSGVIDERNGSFGLAPFDLVCRQFTYCIATNIELHFEAFLCFFKVF